MRTFFVFLFLALFFIVTFPVYLVLLLLRKKNRRLSSKIAQKFVQWGFKFVTFPAGMKRVVLGLENIPKDTAVLYVSNHRSLADIPIAYITVPNLMGFVAKVESPFPQLVDGACKLLILRPQRYACRHEDDVRRHRQH